MRYELIIYPSHYEVIDHMFNRMPVYETRSINLARRERDRLNREDRTRLIMLRLAKNDAALMLELVRNRSGASLTRSQQIRRAFHNVTLGDLADMADEL